QFLGRTRCVGCIGIITVITRGQGAELIPQICASTHAVVFLSVPWSGPERIGRKAFHSAVEELERDHRSLGVHYFLREVDEHKDSENWLSSIGQHNLFLMGAGSLIWLESGTVKETEVSAETIGTRGIASHTLELWAEVG